jgi:hypothetical protein
VYDETYRKAGKMDVSNFVSSLNPFTCRIIDTIQENLLDPGQLISAEMYKLNVYGMCSSLLGSFNVDTLAFPKRKRLFLQSSQRHASW